MHGRLWAIMDYCEEQSTEIEALESIYYDSFTMLAKDPHQFQIVISGEVEGEERLSVSVAFTFTPKYPEEAPLYEILDCDDIDEEKLGCIIDSEIENNLGMAMIFTIASAVQDFLNTIKDELKMREEEERATKERQLQQEEEKKFHGTPVTVESFLIWKLKFDEEMQDLRFQKEKTSEKVKMTGRELFLSDKSLQQEEILEGENPGVTIDESLFEDLDLDDDPDFDPDNFS